MTKMLVFPKLISSLANLSQIGRYRLGAKEGAALDSHLEMHASYMQHPQRQLQLQLQQHFGKCQRTAALFLYFSNSGRQSG